MISIKDIEKHARLTHMFLLSVVCLSIGGGSFVNHARPLIQTPVAKAKTRRSYDVDKILSKNKFISPELGNLITKDFNISDIDLSRLSDSDESDLQANKVYHIEDDLIKIRSNGTIHKKLYGILSDKHPFHNAILHCRLSAKNLYLSKNRASSNDLSYVKFHLYNVTYHPNRDYPYTITFEATRYSHHNQSGIYSIPKNERSNYRLHLHLKSLSQSSSSANIKSNNLLSR